MVPLGLKETKEVDFFEQFSDFILEHYSVDPSNFEDAILDLIDTRQVSCARLTKAEVEHEIWQCMSHHLCVSLQATRTPTRDQNGVDLLCKYYNLLYFAERRFFPVDRNIGLYFEWYDSLTGELEYLSLFHVFIVGSLSLFFFFSRHVIWHVEMRKLEWRAEQQQKEKKFQSLQRFHLRSLSPSKSC